MKKARISFPFLFGNMGRINKVKLPTVEKFYPRSTSSCTTVVGKVFFDEPVPTASFPALQHRSCDGDEQVEDGAEVSEGELDCASCKGLTSLEWASHEAFGDKKKAGWGLNLVWLGIRRRQKKLKWKSTAEEIIPEVGEHPNLV